MTSNNTAVQIIENIATTLMEGEEEITNLDAAIADGDCGAGIKHGFQCVLDKMDELKNLRTGDMFKKIGMILVSSIGGTSGAIFGTGFMKFGANITKAEEVTPAVIGEALDAALAGVVLRGEGTKVGDKTLVDALEPAIDAFKLSLSEGDDVNVSVEKAYLAAKQGSDNTIDLIARKGRASYLGERSRGHRDAGSYVIVLMTQAIMNTVK